MLFRSRRDGCLLYTSLHEEYDELTGTTRTNFLGDVTKTVWKRFTDGHLPDLGTLIRDLSPAFADKDLLLQSTSPATEGLIRQIGAAGAFSPPADSDFLAITTQNARGNKIDWYLRRSIHYQVSYLPTTGAISARVTVSLRNLAPVSYTHLDVYKRQRRWCERSS